LLSYDLKQHLVPEVKDVHPSDFDKQNMPPHMRDLIEQVNQYNTPDHPYIIRLEVLLYKCGKIDILGIVETLTSRTRFENPKWRRPVLPPRITEMIDKFDEIPMLDEPHRSEVLIMVQIIGYIDKRLHEYPRSVRQASQAIALRACAGGHARSRREGRETRSRGEG
jgi:hypothetical protein